MWTRVKQVIAAITAKIEAADRQFVAERLSAAEAKLFWAMNLPDQRHALNVAYTARQLAFDQPQADAQLLIKCALLHDVGKIKGDVSTADKILTVILHKLAPGWAIRWGRLGRGSRLQNVRHGVYIYFHHAARSAAFLREIGGAPAMVDIVARHHEVPADDDPLELLLLRQADNLH